MPKHSKELAAHISELADGLRDIVAGIEKGIMTTQNHYGKYMSILSMPKTEKARNHFGHALIEAGANRQGVIDALRAIG